MYRTVILCKGVFMTPKTLKTMLSQELNYEHSLAVWECKRKDIGNYGVRFTYPSDNGIKRYSFETKTYYGKPSFDKIRTWYYNHVKPELNKTTQWIEILSYYRESGLIPKKVVRRHQNIMYSKFGTQYRNNPEARKYLTKLCFRYIKKYAHCPYCDNKGFEESILGLECNNCDWYWYNLDVRNARWENYN